MMRGARGWLAGIAALVVLASGGVLGYRWIHNRSPYGPDAIHASATIEVTDAADLQSEVTRLGGTWLAPWYGDPGDHLFVGRVNYRVPAGSHGAGQYDIVVIDTADEQVAPLIWGAAASQSAVRSGWQAALGDAATRYAWLAPAGATPDGTDRRTMIFAASDTPGPITFQGAFHRDVGTLTANDLMVALVFVSADGRIYWAQRLSG